MHETAFIYTGALSKEYTDNAQCCVMQNWRYFLDLLTLYREGTVDNIKYAMQTAKLPDYLITRLLQERDSWITHDPTDEFIKDLLCFDSIRINPMQCLSNKDSLLSEDTVLYTSDPRDSTYAHAGPISFSFAAMTATQCVNLKSGSNTIAYGNEGNSMYVKDSCMCLSGNPLIPLLKYFINYDKSRRGLIMLRTRTNVFYYHAERSNSVIYVDFADLLDVRRFELLIRKYGPISVYPVGYLMSTRSITYGDRSPDRISLLDYRFKVNGSWYRDSVHASSLKDDEYVTSELHPGEIIAKFSPEQADTLRVKLITRDLLSELDAKEPSMQLALEQLQRSVDSKRPIDSSYYYYVISLLKSARYLDNRSEVSRIENLLSYRDYCPLADLQDKIISVGLVADAGTVCNAF